jgi:hypothetical protein
VRIHFTGMVLKVAAAIGTLALVSFPAAAQFRQARPKTGKPTPRLADGHPDLGNGKGIWDVQIAQDLSRGDRYKWLDATVEVPMLPHTKQLFDLAQATLSKDDPEGYCLPPGIPRLMNTPFVMQIYQLPDRVMQVYEGGAHMWRPIYTDGRKHTPADKWNPTYLGEGIGSWAGDTLVVDVTGFNTRTWLDAAGHQHGEKLHVTERYTRDDYDTLHYQATIEDPEFYSKPWTVGWHISWVEGWEPYEYICQENNKDVVIENHMVGATPSDNKKKP